MCWLFEQPGISLTSAVTGATLALLATWTREWVRESRRRKRIASAIVCELRVYQGHAQRLQKAAKQKAVIYGPGFSQDLFQALIADAAGLGPTPFIKVRTAYSCCIQVDFLRRRFERRHAISAEDSENLTPAYEAACGGTLTAIAEALEALKPFARRKAYSLPLLELPGTPLEQALNR